MSNVSESDLVSTLKRGAIEGNVPHQSDVVEQGRTATVAFAHLLALSMNAARLEESLRGEGEDIRPEALRMRI